ncbi:MAG: hypothetical protein NC206_04870, partial [Bacteroides sp.]|nr:hypothetical protein [Bacteroides sp.]MCM1421792.1 hypothetical protein [Bacteroides sp.]
KAGFENFVRLENKFRSPCEKNQCALEINFQHLVILGFFGVLGGNGAFGVEFLYLLVGRIILFVHLKFEAQKPP